MKKRLQNLLFYFKRLYEKFDKDQIWFMSSGVSFSILWVIIPTLLVFLGILGFYFDKYNALQQINNYINQALPFDFEAKEKFLDAISNKAYELSQNAWITTVIGLAGVFWAMSSMFSYMRDALNRIYDVKESLNFFKGKLRDFLLLLIIIVLFSLTMVYTSVQQVNNGAIQLLFTFINTNVTTNKLFIIFFPLFISYVMFFFLYRFVPHYKIPTNAILFGSLIAAVMYEILKYLFAYYVLNISNYTRIYGAYAAVVIFMLWVYVISMIFCIGAAIGKIYMELHNLELKFYKKEKYGTEKIIAND
ncbi:MAG: YihY/virulence factor BrkB family protein [Ignavibacteria bacterium]|nr:YihY/virulence factor BrkB family protein [Ignavibacteria bacterium]